MRRRGLAWAWLGIALVTVVPALVLLVGLMPFYSARWLRGFTPPLALDLLLFAQAALGIAGFLRLRPRDASLPLIGATATALAIGYAGVVVALPDVRNQWIFFIPVAALAIGLAGTLITAISVVLKPGDR